MAAYKVVVNSNISNLSTSEAIYDFWNTTIFNENVTEVNDLVDSATSVTTLVWVFKQPSSVNVSFTFKSKPKTALAVTIYTDNEGIKNYDWSTNGNITPTFKTLSEYTGG